MFFPILIKMEDMHQYHHADALLKAMPERMAKDLFPPSHLKMDEE